MRRKSLSLKRIVRGALLPTACIGLVAWFGSYGLNGSNGVFALVRTNEAIAQRADELARVRAERAEIEHRVSLLKPESIDPDLLDELARSTLGYAAPGELIIMRDKVSGDAYRP